MKGFTISELAEALNISKSFLYKMVERRAIPFHKFGNAIRFTEDDVNAFIKQSEQKPITHQGQTIQEEVSYDN
jgi:excisionase family DNA binding protein